MRIIYCGNYSDKTAESYFTKQRGIPHEMSTKGCGQLNQRKMKFKFFLVVILMTDASHVIALDKIQKMGAILMETDGGLEETKCPRQLENIFECLEPSDDLFDYENDDEYTMRGMGNGEWMMLRARRSPVPNQANENSIEPDIQYSNSDPSYFIKRLKPSEIRSRRSTNFQSEGSHQPNHKAKGSSQPNANPTCIRVKNEDGSVEVRCGEIQKKNKKSDAL